MIESTEKWRSDIKKAERILKQLSVLADGLRGINPEHVPTSFARQNLTIAIGQLSAAVLDEKLKYRREVYSREVHK